MHIILIYTALTKTEDVLLVEFMYLTCQVRFTLGRPVYAQIQKHCWFKYFHFLASDQSVMAYNIYIKLAHICDYCSSN